MSLNLSQSIIVDNIKVLQKYISNSKKNCTYILKSGTYSNFILDVDCTGITIKAQDNNVTISGKSQINIIGTYINFIGFKFNNMNQKNQTINIKGKFNKVTNCQFLNYNFAHTHIINIEGQYHNVSYCLFKNITKQGLCIFIYRPDPIENFILINNNQFIDRFKVKNVTNELEIIRIGTSDQSLSSSKTMIINNYLENCCGEIESISIKSCDNLLIGNSLINSCGTFTLRHGNNSILYKNLIDGKNRLNSGGIRITAENHLIYDNILMNINSKEIITVPISVNCGEVKPQLNGYYTSKNCVIKNNIICNCNTIFAIGYQIKSDVIVKPINLLIENNSCYAIDDCEIFITDSKVKCNNDILFKKNNLFASKIGNFTQNIDTILNKYDIKYVPDISKHGINYVVDCNVKDNKLFYENLKNLIISNM